MIRLIFLFALAITFAQCDDQGSSIPRMQAEISFRPSQIYNVDSVAKFISSKSLNDSLAFKYLGEAKEFLPLFPDKAVHCLKRSITFKPTAEAYIRLAELLTEQEKFREASSAYNVLCEVFPGFSKEADKEVFFDMVYVAARDAHRSHSIYSFIGVASSAGVSEEEVKEYLKNEPRLDPVRNTAWFRDVLRYSLDQIYNFGDTISFDGYLAIFEKREQELKSKSYPFVIGIEQLTDLSEYANADWYWPFRDFLAEDKTNSYFHFREYRKLPEPGPGISAVIYGIDTSVYAARKEMRMVYYRLVTYDKTGNKIDNMIIAKHLGEELCTAEMISPNELALSYSRRTYKNPFRYNDMDNEVVNTEPEGNIIVTINNKGEIIVRDEEQL